MRLPILFALTLTLLSAEPREALLIGNSNYKHITNLDDPSSNLKRLKTTLKGLDFNVDIKTDLNSEDLEASIDNFAKRLSKSSDSIGLLYYTGHGCQVDYQGYLVPTNVNTKIKRKIKYNAMNINEMLETLKDAGNRVNMVFLDACRDVPTGAKGGTKGLGQPTNTPNGSLVVYATKAGEVANDNSYFIDALIKNLKTSNQTVRDLGDNISLSVAQKSSQQQIPMVYSSLLPKLLLNKKPYLEQILKVHESKVNQKVESIRGSIKKGFLPKNPSFPHGKGITRKEGKCNEKDNGCARGLPFPSFNNYIDSGSGTGINDERRFLTVNNQTVASGFTNSVSAKVNDQVYLRAYIHNNGYCEDSKNIAYNTTLKMTGFSNIGNGVYETEAKTSISLRQFITSSSAIPLSISDDAFVTSITGKKIKLQFRPSISILKTTLKNKTINPTYFFSTGGVNIGNRKACVSDAFFTQLTLFVVDGETTNYDLSVHKSVNNGKEEEIVNNKDVLKYELYVENKKSSIGTPSNVTIYDDYDETKISIVKSSLSSACHDNGSKIICNIPNTLDLSPGKNAATRYSAIIKEGATGTILNTAEVRPNPDYDTYQGNDRDSVVVTIQNKI